jgi:YegS/Rv2252/BmrU family lipid kinase
VPATVCVIVNPAAGGGQAGRVADDVLRALRAHGLGARCIEAGDPRQAGMLARGAALAGETVAVLGGDGLIGIVADALREVPGAMLGVLPAGRGNDLARVLGIPPDPVAACATIARGESVAMDVGEVRTIGEDGLTHRASAAFVGIASTGFDSEANRIANEAPPRLGRLVYAYGALRALLGWSPARFEIELEPPGRRRTVVGYSIVAANSRAYGGGMRMAPDALLDDGMLDVVAVSRMGRLRFLWNLRRVFRGTHLRLPAIEVFRVRCVRIWAERPFTLYADGDPIADLPVEVRALQGSIRVLVPPRAHAQAGRRRDRTAGAASAFSAPGERRPRHFEQPPREAVTGRDAPRATR